MINKFYILAGFTIGVGVYAVIRTIRNDVRLEETTDKVNNALNRIDTLEFEYKELKKERIDNWVDTASDILEGQQDSIDRLESDVGDLIMCTKYQNKDIDSIEDDKEIKEVLEKTAGVKFTSGEEDFETWQRERSVLQSYKMEEE